MFGLPIELLSLLISTIMGAFFKSKAQDQDDRHRQTMSAIEINKVSNDNINDARKYNTEGSSKTRKFIVIMVLGLASYIVIAPTILGKPVLIPVEITTGFRFLFIDTVKTVVEWKTFEGVLTPEWLPSTITSIVGFYFGQAMVQRK